MKQTVKIRLLIAMLLIGIIFGISFYFLTSPLTISDLIHCLIMGIIFGLLNYFICYAFINKYVLLKHDNETLKYENQIDKLTGLFNRRAFDEKLETMSLDGAYSMIFVDIDNFREFNNNYGHQAGDDVLRKVSATILENLGQSDKAYRYGGEEIVIILKGSEKQAAYVTAEKIRRDIAQLDNTPYPHIYVSIGISSYPSDGDHYTDILKSCDSALLEAKRAGKNLVYTS